MFGAVEQAVPQDIEMPWAEELQQVDQGGDSLGGGEDGPHALRDLLLIAFDLGIHASPSQDPWYPARHLCRCALLHRFGVA